MKNQFNSLTERAFLDILRQPKRMIHKICYVHASDVSTKQDFPQEIIFIV
jgi:hypothetical protein